ncbi:MAG: acetylxylan esterase [Phototrophicaceae bacterium]
MPFFDLPLAELERYTAANTEPADFDAFWDQTLAAARAFPLNTIFRPYDAGLKLVDVFDVSYSGYGGQMVKGWYIRPTNTPQPLPCVVEYIGYGGGRGFPHSWLGWPTAGYALFVMDTRGQGSAWSRGDTPDLPEDANPFYPGFMTQGILDPKHYYYRRVFTDAVRAIDVVLSRADVDPQRIAVTGGSQGGGISIAAAGLMGDKIAVCMPDVPFLCDFRRAVGLTESHPYQEIAQYLKIHRNHIETAFNTLAYFDGVNLSKRIRAASLYSTALMDPICPPSTVFAAYNALTVGDKDIKVYEFNLHEGGQEYQFVEKLRFLAARF